MKLVLILFLFSLVSCNNSKDLSKSLGNNIEEDTTVAVPSPAPTIPQTTLSIVSGNLQSGATSVIFPDPLRIQLLNNGSPLVGHQVLWTIVSGPAGVISTSTSATDASGLAQVFFTAGVNPGTTVIRATYLNYTADFTLVSVGQTNSSLITVSGNSQSGIIGTSLSQPLVVETRDATTMQPSANVLIRFSVSSGNGRINSSVNTLVISTDLTGRASVNFDLGTISGVNTVTASVVSLPSQSVTFSSTGLVSPSSPVDLSQSLVTAAASALIADGSQTTILTLTTKDVYGNTIPLGGKSISFTANTGTLIGSVNDLGNGTYTQLVRAPLSNSIPIIQITGSVNSSPLTSTPGVIGLIAGNFSHAHSTIATSASSITADGNTTMLITLTLRDSLGNQVSTGGQSVVFTTSRGTLIGAVSDVGNGTYTQTLRSGTVAGSAIITATAGGAPITNNATISFTPGAPDPTKSLIITSPSTLPPDGSSLSIITVQLRDAYNNICSNAVGRTILLTKDNGTWLGSTSSTISATSNGDGTYFGILMSSISTGSALITGTDNSSPLQSSARVYFSSGNIGPNVNTSTLGHSGSNIRPADSSTLVPITVTLRDSFGLPLTSGGSNVVISSTAGTMVGNVTDNGNGTYTQSLRASSNAAIATVTATVDGNQIVDQKVISFYGSMSLAQSSLTASPSSILANGISTTILIINAKDDNGVSIPVGGETGLSFATTHGILLGSIVDNGNGTYTQQLRSMATQALAVVSASKGSNTLSSTVNVEFYNNTNLAGLTIDCANINTYKNTTILVNNGTLTMNSRGSAGNCPNDFVFNGIVLQNNAIITHSTATLSQEFGLELTAGYITIDATSRIDVSGRGYTPSATTGRIRTQGNQDFVSAVNSVGGSYGGHGYSSSGPAFTNNTYGSIFQPTDLGSSGVNSGSGNGGGRLKLTVTGPAGIENAGQIRADGGIVPSTHWTSGAGSGGSIWIITSKLSSTGAISANGGSRNSVGTFAYPGGGGRIAIYYPSTADISGNFSYPTNILANVSAAGGEFTGSVAAGAGTIYLKSATQLYGDLIISNRGLTTATGFTNGTVINSPNIGASEAVNSNSLSKTGVFADAYSTVSPYVGWYLDPNINQNSSPRKADNQLFRITSANVNTLTTTGGNMAGVSSVGNTAELVLIFDNFELGDKTLISSGNLRIISYGGDLKNNNTTAATMTDTLPPRGIEYPGLGSLNINLVTRTLPSFLVEDMSGTDFTVSNGTYNFGSVVTKNFLSAAMTMNGTRLRSTGNVTFNATTANFTQTVGNLSIHADGAVDVIAGSTINQAATTSSIEYSLEIQAGSFNLASGTTLSARGRGFPAVSGCNFRVFANQCINVAFNNTTNHTAGGSHAGRGGVTNTSHWPSEVWGNFKNPYTSGGASIDGAGGGIIRITTTNSGAVNISGSINARGTTNGRAGAGGSIYISGGLVTGAGVIDASGESSTGPSGGGGRIAVYFTSLGGNFTYPTNALANIRAYGGFSSTNNIVNGAAGTIFMKSATETFGKLIVNNNSSFATDQNSRRTVISFPTSLPSSSVSFNPATGTSTLSLPAGFAERYGDSDAFVGMYLNPNVAQNATQTITDDTLFEVVSQTDNTLTVLGNITAVATSGNVFQLNMRLDELRVVGTGILEVNNGVILTDKLDVTNGQIVGTGFVETTTTDSLNLNANGGVIRLNNFSASSMTFQNGTFVLPTNQPINIPGSLTLSSAVVSSSGHSITLGGNLSMSATSSLTASTLNLGGFLSLASSTLTTTGAVSVGDDLILTTSTASVSGNISVGDDLLLDSTSTLTQANGLTAAVTGDVSVLNLSNLFTNVMTVGGSVLVDNASSLSNGRRVLTPFTTYNTVPSLIVNDTVTISNGSTLTSPATSATEEYYLFVSGSSLTVGVNSFINVDGRGYRSITNARFRTIGNVDSLGHFGLTTSTNTTAAGSYGGQGGTVNGSHFSNRPYGSFMLPIHLGSSGNCSWMGVGCNSGGGSVRILLTGSLNLAGIISANGMTSANGSGSGGSVFIQTSALTGTGTIRANGPQTAAGDGGGSGGRVAVYYNTLGGDFATPSIVVSKIQAWGGVGANQSQRGAAGTVYLKRNTQTFGDLIVNNNGLDSTNFTEIPWAVETVSSALTTNTLTTASGFRNVYNLNNFFQGLFVNPNTAQNATARLDDDSVFTVQSNTASVLTVGPASVDTVASSGNPFVMQAIFDNLEVSGRGRINFPAQRIRVISGDFASNNSTSFVLDGGITTGVVDVGAGVNWTSTANASGTVTTRCSSNFPCP